MTKTVLLIGFVFLPPVLSFLIPNWKSQLIAGHGFFGELLLVFWLSHIARKLQQKKDMIDYWVLVFATVCLFFADSIYNIKVLAGRDIALLPTNLSEFLYTGFVSGMFVFLSRRLWKNSRSSATLAFMILMAILHGSLTFKYVLIPFYNRETPPATPFNLANSTIYAVISTLIFSLVMPYVARVTRVLDHWFLQSILFLEVSDFAIRYQTAFVSDTAFSWADPGWNMAIAGMLAVVALNRNQKELLAEDSPISTYFSVRCLLTVVTSVASALLLVGIQIFNLYTVKNAFHLTSVLFLLFVIWVVSNALALKLSGDFTRIRKLMLDKSEAVTGPELPEVKVSAVEGKTFLFETDQFIASYNALVQKTNLLIDSSMQQAKKVSMGNLAAQVAHDIRSPLAAIQGIEKDLVHLPEDTRVLLRSAIGRIRDIANNLIEKNREISLSKSDLNSTTAPSKTAETFSTQLLSSLVDGLLSEKRTQYRSKLGVDLDWQMNEAAYGLFVQIQPIEFKRVLSNLINNSVEALSDRGSVRVELSRVDAEGQHFVQVRIVDSGKGIPSEIISKLGQKGVTVGKDGGSGLGLYHARTTVESWGGKLEIQSELGRGTVVTLTLPHAEFVPKWFVPTLDIPAESNVVILDDDSSIHQIWQGRFDSSGFKNKDIGVFHFSTPEEMTRWVTEKSDLTDKCMFLLDFELIGFKDTGLDVAESLKIASKSILVTSRFEEKQIVARCERLGVRMIPKGMAPFVPMKVTQAAPSLERFDAVLIDDDFLVHSTWRSAAKQFKKSLLTFSNADSFFGSTEILHPSTPIYVDANLGDGIDGTVVAKKIFDLGFKNVFLATGYEADEFLHLTFLAGILGKDPPWTG